MDIVQEAFDKLGGYRSLADWAEDNKDTFYRFWLAIKLAEAQAEAQEDG